MRLLLAAAFFSFSSACVVVADCGPGLTDCGGYCADLNGDETDCGACGAPCAVGDYCSLGVCIVGTCIADASPCAHDSDCCSNYCASDGNCGCIPSGVAGCAGSTDCCSGLCNRNGVCN
jgi:hypothetical protein